MVGMTSHAPPGVGSQSLSPRLQRSHSAPACVCAPPLAAVRVQIFPRHVIEALSMGNKEDLDIELVAKMARSHAHVTVLFMGE